ncbi:MAG: Holliday junction resolvase RuvX [Chloroflexi bacterium]|nr:Holliday junction resolvase RuvX [Chloroflexota bacterium]
MRVMALDVGDKRIGVALSDPLGMLASPLTTIERRTPDIAAAIDAILALADEHAAEEILVGIPYLMSGRIGAQTRITLDFADELAARAKILITRIDERLSSVQAERMLAQAGITAADRARDRGTTDAAAAAIMLQAHLDAKP